MSTKQSTIDFLLDQFNQHTTVTYRKMFGEYALYCQGKVVALVCEDQLFIKPTVAGRALLQEVDEQPPYPGAKLYYLISGDDWDNDELLGRLFLATAKELPLPKPKKNKKLAI